MAAELSSTISTPGGSFSLRSVAKSSSSNAMADAMQKHFKQKNLIILRACNELLRRLSRAEDTVFCGRVFIFLFQSFPLGDRSSVNLRGEYHIENVTTHENIERRIGTPNDGGMDVDVKEETKVPLEIAGEDHTSATEKTEDQSANLSATGPKYVGLRSEKADSVEEIPDMDTLYSMFWSLQDYFSQPIKLFDNENLQAFKSGLHVSMAKFKQIHQEQQARGSSKVSIESKRGTKRKRGGQDEQLASSFNPKYLTSRDLFDLEISDLAFRRHILVQALILLDFLLSLTPKAKKKLEHMSNKSVLYAYSLDEENARWATKTRGEIATYLQEGPEGKFYYRMVDTVLSRDKNWVHWKAEGCPPIARESVSADDYAEAEKGAEKACTNRRIRPVAMGALDLAFLSQNQSSEGMEKLTDPARYTIPAINSFKGPIAEDDFDIGMAKNEEEKQLASDARASKLWRTLRVASKSRLNVFDKIDDGNNLRPLFEPDVEDDKNKVEPNGMEVEVEPPLQTVLRGTEETFTDDDTGVISKENVIM